MSNSGTVPISNREGENAYSLIKYLWPINRSLSGDGVRKTLMILKQNIGIQFQLKSVKTGTKCFDWTVPNEWNIRDAWIKNSKGEKIIDFKTNNLHLVGYSEPVDALLSLDELRERLHTLPDKPDAIPYITSYYKQNWGFCMTYEQYKSLDDEKYHVFIDSTLSPGRLDYGEVVIPGKERKEVLFSTYICHPSMANNELSGPAVACQLISWLQAMEEKPRYTYRFLFLQETIGSIAFLSKNYRRCQQRVVAGYVLTCVGDERTYSYLPSRSGDTLSDRAAKLALHNKNIQYKAYTWLDRGSDERQYCSPGIDLPISSVMRSKYSEYPEYHTSKDNFDLVTVNGLQGSIDLYKLIIFIIEHNFLIVSNVKCEPQLGKRGLYPSTSSLSSYNLELKIIDTILTYADSKHDFIDICEMLDCSIMSVAEKLVLLHQEKLIKLRNRPGKYHRTISN